MRAKSKLEVHIRSEARVSSDATNALRIMFK